MGTDAIARKALKSGQQQAKGILSQRSAALKRRAAAVACVLEKKPITRAAIAPALAKAVGGPESAGTLLAEGDSWFDYPLNDVLSILEDDYGYEVESVAHKGDTIEDMAYVQCDLTKTARACEKLLRRGVIPKAILLSGGGNDIAGDEFAMLLNHANSPIAGFNKAVVSGVIDERIRVAYITLLAALTHMCEEWFQQRIQILIHGYDYPVPDGRGFIGGWGFLPGPWLEPGFRQKGFTDLPCCTAMAKQLIDRFNQMLQDVVALSPFAGHVKHVDLRGTLSTGKDHEDWWANELHPTHRGFVAIANQIADAV